MRYIKPFEKSKNKLFTGNIGGSKKTEFQENQIFQIDGEPQLCKNGFHFYEENKIAHGINLFGENTVYHFVEPLNKIVSDEQKCCSTKIKILDQFVPNWSNEKFCLQAVKQNGWTLQYVENQTEEICLEAVKENGYALKFVKNQTGEICLQAVKECSSALEFVKNQNIRLKLKKLFNL